MLNKPCHFLVLLLVGLSSTRAYPECSGSVWSRAPVVERGIFTAELEAGCQAESRDREALPRIFTDILKSVNSDTQVLARTQILLEGLRGFRFDLIRRLQEDDVDITLQETLLVAHSSDKLIYRSEAKKLHAEGTARHLKRVRFGMELDRLDHAYQAKMNNSIWVERPWYAPNLLFRWIASNVATEKFAKAKTALWDLIQQRI